jgi:hypothetical protein
MTKNIFLLFDKFAVLYFQRVNYKTYKNAGLLHFFFTDDAKDQDPKINVAQTKVCFYPKCCFIERLEKKHLVF